jgi:hypothetical protein
MKDPGFIFKKNSFNTKKSKKSNQIDFFRRQARDARTVRTRLLRIK